MGATWGGTRLNERLQVLVEEAGAVAVPEEGHVPKLLRLAARKRVDARRRQVLPCPPRSRRPVSTRRA